MAFTSALNFMHSGPSAYTAWGSKGMYQVLEMDGKWLFAFMRSDGKQKFLKVVSRHDSKDAALAAAHRHDEGKKAKKTHGKRKRAYGSR